MVPSGKVREVSVRSERFEYTVDAQDVIQAVNEPWRNFAEKNEAFGLGDKVIGTWLWQHMEGLEIKHLYRSLLDRVRKSGQAVQIPFRCDSPGMARYMVIEVIPLEEGAVRFASWIENEVPREEIRALEAGQEVDPDRIAKMCTWCKRIDVGRDDWRELEEGLSQAGLLKLDPVPRIQHGVCPDCRTMVLREITDSD